MLLMGVGKFKKARRLKEAMGLRNKKKVSKQTVSRTDNKTEGDKADENSWGNMDEKKRGIFEGRHHACMPIYHLPVLGHGGRGQCFFAQHHDGVYPAKRGGSRAICVCSGKHGFIHCECVQSIQPRAGWLLLYARKRQGCGRLRKLRVCGGWRQRFAGH